MGPSSVETTPADFSNLCLAGAAGMMIWLAGRGGSSGLGDEQFGVPAPCGPLERVGQRLREFVLHWNAANLVAMILIVCIVAGIFCSLSRGAFLAMIGATLITAVVVSCARRRIVGGWHFALIATAGLGLVSWVGMSDTVESRLATLLNQDTMEKTRIPHWKDCAGGGP